MESINDTKTLIEEAYHKIKQMIFQQDLGPGQKLIYRDLSKILNMSLTPIVNALYRLEQEGYVLHESFRGFCVKPVDVQEAWDLFGFREALEVYSIEQAIDRALPEEIQILEKKRCDHEQYVPPYYDKKKAALEAGFHLQIAAMARNKVVEASLKSNFQHLYLRFDLMGVDPNRMRMAIQEHYEIMDSIRRKDIAGAVEAIRSHVRKGRNAVVAGISKKKEAIQLL